MANANKIFERLQKEYTHVKTFIVARIEEPIWFACNKDASSFCVVSIYLDSEIGGEFSISEGEGWIDYIYEDFDERLAYDLRENIIADIEAGTAVFLGDIKQSSLH